MFEIDGNIVSSDLLTESFACDLKRCKGICCVEGNAGAPLDEEEALVLEREYPRYRPFMTPDGRAAIESQGFAVRDEDDDLTTPLVAGAECAYSTRQDGITVCAIEKAFLEGRTPFRKPISCHLYPIRLIRFSNGAVGLNYHRWSVCAAARTCGLRTGTPVYRAVEEAIVRRFGRPFYEALDAAAKFMEQNKKQ